MNKLDALVADDKATWEELSRQAGDILPSNPEILDNMFLLAQMRCKHITIEKRTAIREDLMKRGIVRETEPITVLEKLASISAKNFVYAEITDMVKQFSEVVLVFTSDIVRRRTYMKAAEALRGSLDGKRCSIPMMELYTIGGVRIKFLLDNDYYEPPLERVCYRIIYDV